MVGLFFVVGLTMTGTTLQPPFIVIIHQTFILNITIIMETSVRITGVTEPTAPTTVSLGIENMAATEQGTLGK